MLRLCVKNLNSTLKWKINEVTKNEINSFFLTASLDFIRYIPFLSTVTYLYVFKCFWGTSQLQPEMIICSYFYSRSTSFRFLFGSKFLLYCSLCWDVCCIVACFYCIVCCVIQSCALLWSEMVKMAGKEPKLNHTSAV